MKIQLLAFSCLVQGLIKHDHKSTTSVDLGCKFFFYLWRQSKLSYISAFIFPTRKCLNKPRVRKHGFEDLLNPVIWPVWVMACHRLQHPNHLSLQCWHWAKKCTEVRWCSCRLWIPDICGDIFATGTETFNCTLTGTHIFLVLPALRVRFHRFDAHCTQFKTFSTNGQFAS